MIKILAIAPYPIYPTDSGGRKAVFLFYKYLALEVPVSIVTVAGTSYPEEFKAKILPWLGPSRFRYLNLFLVFRMYRLIRNQGYTHLLLEHPYFGWLGWALNRLCGIPLVVRSHNIEGMRFKSIGKYWWRILWTYEKWTYKKADPVFFITGEDREFAIKTFGLNDSKCMTVPYGTELRASPSVTQRMEAKQFLMDKYSIKPGTQILFFNGTLAYKPNLDALDFILHTLNPELYHANRQAYKIIVTGSRLPPQYDHLNDFRGQNIIYAGFVPEIEPFYLGSDLFLNPVNDGGGVKTKLVEALAYNLSVVSTLKGAHGVPLKYTGEKMKIAETEMKGKFSEALYTMDTRANIPVAFYDYYYWGNISKEVKRILSS